MKASKFTDAQKAFVVKQGEEGTPVAEICARQGSSVCIQCGPRPVSGRWFPVPSSEFGRVLKFARFPRLALVPSTGSLSPEHRADAPIPLRYSVRSPYGQSLPQFGIQPHVALSTRIQPIISIWQSSVELRAGALRPKASHTPSSNSKSEGCAVHDKRQSN